MRHFTAYELNILNSHNVDPQSITDLDIPVEYIVGEGEFCEQFFKLDKSTLIPRVETEYLIELALHNIANKVVNFADIGCGSGAIGLTFGIQLALRNIMFKAQLSDISEDALKIAQENYNLHKDKLAGNKVLLFRSNLLSSYSKTEKLDIIFANLPYIPSARINKLAKSVREFEPLTALDGGPDGLNLIRQILKSAPEYISKNGVLLLEVDDTHKDASEFKDIWQIEVKNDFNGKIRYWVCHQKGSKT